VTAHRNEQSTHKLRLLCLTQRFNVPMRRQAIERLAQRLGDHEGALQIRDRGPDHRLASFSTPSAWIALGGASWHGQCNQKMAPGGMIAKHPSACPRQPRPRRVGWLQPDRPGYRRGHRLRPQWPGTSPGLEAGAAQAWRGHSGGPPQQRASTIGGLREWRPIGVTRSAFASDRTLQVPRLCANKSGGDDAHNRLSGRP
jgi:hypothetical protein